MDNQQIVELFQTVGLPTALCIYLLISNSKQTDKYESLITQITEEMKQLNDNIKSLSTT